MALSHQSLEILLDLIEIKVSSLQIQDRDDARELNKLRKCRQELLLGINNTSRKCPEKFIELSTFSEKPPKKRSYLGN
jgi:hypothetical protein